MIVSNEGMPAGLSMGLGMNEKAMSNYAAMTEEEKQQVIAAARNVETKQEMQKLVKNIARLNDENTVLAKG